MGSFDKD